MIRPVEKPSSYYHNAYSFRQYKQVKRKEEVLSLKKDAISISNEAMELYKKSIQ